MRRALHTTSSLAMTALASMLVLSAAARAVPVKPSGASTTPTVTTPASAKIGQPTTISPTASTTTPAVTAPSTSSTPATSATTPSSTTPSTSTPATVPTTTVPTTATAPTTVTTVPGQLHPIPKGASPAAHAGSKKISTEAIVLAVIAALVVLACAAWALARSRAYEPHWLLSLRYAMAEAGFRASATWAEFTDWVRLGR